MRHNIFFKSLFLGILFLFLLNFSLNAEEKQNFGTKSVVLNGEDLDVFKVLSPYDPLEPVNRAFFEFNDAVYLWLFRPLSKVYSFILPYSVRKGVDNIVLNLEFIIRGISCLLEGEFYGGWVETERFLINLTIGVIGIYDAAEMFYGIHGYNEDFGQAFASWGIGPGPYFVIPILGPSNIRDAIGEIFFFAFHPITWVPLPGIGFFVFVNRVSLRIKHYMEIRDPSLDAYSSMKDFSYLNRKIQVDNLDRIPPENRGGE